MNDIFPKNWWQTEKNPVKDKQNLNKYSDRHILFVLTCAKLLISFSATFHIIDIFINRVSSPTVACIMHLSDRLS